MKLNKIIHQFRFDKRLVEWNLSNKTISAEEYKNHLKSLADDSDSRQDMFSEPPHRESQPTTSSQEALPPLPE